MWTGLLGPELPLEITQDTAGSGFGAALLGRRALGHLPSLDDTAAVIRLVREPSPPV